MALIFSLRGDSLDARYVSQYGAHGQYSTNAASLETSGWAGELGGSSIKLRNGTSAQICGLLFPGRNNTPAKGFSINLRIGFADNAGLFGLFCLGGGPSSNANSIFAYYNSGSLNFRWNDGSQTARLTVSGTWTPTINTFYDIFFRWDGTTTASNAELYVDGSLLNSDTSGLARPTDDRKQVNYICLGATAFDVQNTCIDINEFTIWDSYEDPTAILLNSGSGSLNGASRVSNIACSAFDGAGVGGFPKGRIVNA